MRLAELQEGTANESFAEYVVERLETCIRNVSVLVEHLRAATDNQEAAITATRYSALLTVRVPAKTFSIMGIIS